jgi:hypothetical protein
VNSKLCKKSFEVKNSQNYLSLDFLISENFLSTDDFSSWKKKFAQTDVKVEVKNSLKYFRILENVLSPDNFSN